jgi:hypothetical protein
MINHNFPHTTVCKASSKLEFIEISVVRLDMSQVCTRLRAKSNLSSTWLCASCVTSQSGHRSRDLNREWCSPGHFRVSTTKTSELRTIAAFEIRTIIHASDKCFLDRFPISSFESMAEKFEWWWRTPSLPCAFLYKGKLVSRELIVQLLSHQFIFNNSHKQPFS